MDNVALAQETLEEKRKRADELFEDKKWSEAEALYASIITDSPRNHDLNFRYGTCVLNGSKNEEEAIRFLRYSITGSGIDKRAYYYLGRAYHLNYQFNDAITYYTKFKELASPSDLKDLDVVTDLKACAFGKKLMSNITDMIVIKKDELPAEDFYDKYDLSDIGGQLLVTDIFQSKLDKKMNHRPIIHFPSNSPYIYYSSYGEDGETGLDIYVQKKLPGGEWSLAQKVRGNVNTDLDENYAYMHPNGEYLYFSSKGHNSMGGYDVFRSRFNPETQSFGAPENMDFAISSPDDDIFFVVDSLDQNAYFASARESAYGNLSVYKVRVDRIPMQMAVIKGNFLNIINAGDKEVEIEITDFSTGELIGKFNSKQTNGDYLLTFPKSGKYQFAITPKGSLTTFGYIVNIPPSKEFKPLGQQMTLVNQNGEEQITVKDQFDKVFDDPAGILAEVYRELSKLPPNSTKFNLDSLDALKETDKVLVDAGLDPYLTKEGLKAVLKDGIEDLTEAQADEKKQANIAYNVALEKSIEANQKMVELNEQIKLAEATDDPIEKNRILEDVNKAKAQIEQLNNESQVFIDLAETIEKSIADKQVRIDKANEVYTEAIGLEEGNGDALLAVVSKNAVYFQDNVKNGGSVENATTNALQQGAAEQKRVQALSEEISDLSKERRNLIAANEKSEKQKASAKKKDVEAIQRMINSNNSEIAVLESNIDRKSEELDKAIAENATVREGLAASIILKDDYRGSKYENTVSAGDKAAIKNQVKSNNLDEILAMVDEVLEKNNVSAFNIELYANDEKTNNYTLAEWDEAIDQEQELLRQEKLNASRERQGQIQDEIDRLEKLRQEKMAAYEVVEEDPRSIKSEINEDDILPNYTKRKGSIDEIVTENDRRNANRELNYEILEEVANERKRLEQILANDPKAKNIAERLENLDIIERQLRDEIKADEEWLAVNDIAAPLSKDELLYSIAPDYQARVNAAYEIVDDEERNRAINDLNQVILGKSNERIQELNAILESDPSNERARNELAGLEELVADINSNKNQALVEPEKANIDDLTSEVVLTDLITDFDQRKDEIQNMPNERARRIAENQLYADLIMAANREEGKLEGLAADYPDNKTIEKRREALDDIKNEYEEEISNNKDWLAANPEEQPSQLGNLNLNPTASSVMPPYSDRMSGITNSDNTAIEKENAKIGLNEELIAKIDGELGNTADLKTEYPNELERLNQLTINLEALKADIQSKINASKERIADLENPAVVENVRSTISITSLMPTYESSLADIRNGNSAEEDKLNSEYDVHEALLDICEVKMAELETEKENNPEDAVAINKDIQDLSNIQRNAQNEMNSNANKIAQLNSASLNRPEISVSELLPDFDGQMAEIENGNLPAIEKLKAKNELNNRLLKAIEIKMADIEDELEADPDNSDIYNQELDKLSELKEAKRSEVAQNNEEIAAIEAEDVNIAALKTSDFNTTEGSAALSEFDKEIAELNEVNASLEDLRNQLDASTDEKEQAKIQKQIDKEEKTKASIENEVIEGLDEANDAEVASLNADLEMNQKITKNASHVEENGLSEEIQKANENLVVASQKMNQAQDLRDEADDIKDPIEANEKLTEAYKLENEAKDLLNESKRIFKMAISLNESADEDEVLTSVSENEEDRKSAQKMEEAARLRDEANALYIRSSELADSSLTVKRKNQAPIIQEANKLTEKANQLSDAANQIEDEAEDLKAQEEELLARSIEVVDKEVDEETKEEVGTSDAYKDYFAKKNEADDLMGKVDDLDEEIAELKDKRARTFKMAISLNDDSQEAAEVDNEISDLQVQINQLIALKKQLKEDALTAYDAANEVLDGQTDSTTRVNLMALAQNNVQPFEKAAPEAADFEVPDEITEDIFRTTNGAVYSDDAPIPMNNKRTGGLVYKVQVGAFRNPLPQDHFKEFAPISGEVLANGITRFMVGYFKKFAPANDAKGKVNGIGYSDAFVVAYCNGVRITIDQALLIEQGLMTCDPVENFVDNTIIENTVADNGTAANDTNRPNTNINPNFNADENDQSNQLELDPQTAEERNLTNYYTSVPEAAKANQIEIIDGLFYTVQIGVYSKPVTNSALFGIQPLNSQQTTNGFIRYSTGIFTSVEAATARKNEVVGLGIQDAFVTAYYDGDRITVDQALVILRRDGAEALVGRESNTANTGETGNTGETDVTNNGESAYYKEGLYYKILIGKYRDAIPGEYATLLLRGDDIFETEVDQDGRTLLISSKLQTYEELLDKLSEFSELGIEDMDIVTFYKYDVIPYEQGQKIRNEEQIDDLTPYDDIEGISATPFIYAKDAVYFKIKLGEFEEKISPEFANLLLLHEEEENIQKEEGLDGVTECFTGSVTTYEEAEVTKQRLIEKGFGNALIMAYHKYDEISVETARKILGQ